MQNVAHTPRVQRQRVLFDFETGGLCEGGVANALPPPLPTETAKTINTSNLWHSVKTFALRGVAGTLCWVDWGWGG